MKQKYLILNGKNENELVIRESAELDKGIVSELFEVTYDRGALKAACENDRAAILAAIRTPIFYPTALCADRLAEAIADFFAAGGSDTVEVLFDDHEALGARSKAKEIEEEPASETELEMLLGSNPEEENLLEDEDIKEIAPPAAKTLKVADENGLGEDDP